VEKLRASYASDKKKIQQILKQLERDSLKALKYQPHGGLLFYIKRNYIRKKIVPSSLIS